MSYGVFSKHLLERFNWVEKLPKDRNLFNEELLPTIASYDDEIDGGVFICSSYPNDQIAEQIQYKVWYEDDLKKVLRWVIYNIVRTISKASYDTIDVKVRIATSMLNSLTITKKLTIDENIRIHDNMVRNLLDLKKDCIDASLPF